MADPSDEELREAYEALVVRGQRLRERVASSVEMHDDDCDCPDCAMVGGWDSAVRMESKP